MNLLDQTEPKAALAYFSLICSIPHPSGYEQKLAEKIISLAKKNGLTVKQDPAGNVRIDRPAADGFETAPKIILQGHLDMVPKAAPGKIFDFTKDPIRLVVENGVVHADGTTLGADNGAGVASALALLFDPDLKTGALAGLFTVGEEVGLIGANALAPEMLEGDWLFNLDSGTYDKFCIGCAGGARLSFQFPFRRTEAPAGNCYSVKLSGLAGGHSGIGIHERRGNALIFLAQFLDSIPGISLISFSGGSVDNAIPSDAEALIVSALSREELLRLANNFVQESSKTFSAPAEYGISVHCSDQTGPVIDPEFSKAFLSLAATVPNGVFAFDDALKIVKTSSNFASVKTSGTELVVRTSQRSLNDDDRVQATEQVISHFSGLDNSHSVDGVYPGWPADPESEPVKIASISYREMFGKNPGIYAIHAGLETGAFAKKNPALKILSFGPDEKDVHTEFESFDLQKYQEFNQLLRFIVEQTTKGT